MNIVDAYRWWIFAVFAVLYAVTFTGRWLVTIDSGLYMSLGRNLAEGRGYTYQGVPHDWYEPGLPWVIAGLFRVFGVDHFRPLLMFMLLCGVGTLVLNFFLFRRHAGRPMAVLLTALLAVNETFLRYNYQVVSDTPFVCAVMGFLLACDVVVHRRPGQPKWQDTIAWIAVPLAGFVISAMRPNSLTFVGTVWITVVGCLVFAPRKSHWLRYGLVAIVLTASFLVFRSVDPRVQARDHAENYREGRLKALLTTDRDFAIKRALTGNLPQFIGEIFPESVVGVEMGDGFDWPFSLFVLGGAMVVGICVRQPLWAAWVATTAAQSIFWLPRERYILPVLPVLLYTIVVSTDWIGRDMLARGWRRWWTVPSVAAVVLLVVFNIGFEIKFLINQRHAGVDQFGRGDREVSPYIELMRQIQSIVDQDDIVISNLHVSRIVSYFGRLRAVSSQRAQRWEPTPEEQREYDEQFELGREIGSARQIYVVLPDDKNKTVQKLLDRLGATTSPPLVTIPQTGKNTEPVRLLKVTLPPVPATAR